MSNVSATSSMMLRLIVGCPAAKPASSALSQRLFILLGMPSEQRTIYSTASGEHMTMHSATVTGFQHLAQGHQQLGFCLPFLDIQQSREVLVKLRDRQAGIEDVGDQHSSIQTLHHPTQNCGLPGAYFPGYYDQALTTFDAIVKVGHHFSM